MKASITSDLTACKAAFDKTNILWSITDGVVLGYARNKEIMAWDTDLDIGIFVEISNKQWNRLHQALYSNGFKLPKQKTDFMYCHRKADFGMGLFHKKGNFYEQFPETTPGIKFVEKANWHDKPQTVNFLGDKYPIPNNLDDYLNCRYEKDWKTNIIKNAEQFFIYKRGSRTDQSIWLKGRSSKHGHLWPKILKISDINSKVLSK